MNQGLLDVAQRLYDALNARDPQGIMRILSPDFVGVVSDGMPLGVGGRHVGAESMLRGCWGKVFAAYDMRINVEDRLLNGGERVLFTGRYAGTARGTGHALDAAFAHLLRVDGERVTELVQFTDTARWHLAARDD